uniref:Uncharacterized protein n=1 Tax=Romanomermis culicivorax TaxID=13658 RepID=A0A915IVN3_ROMCU
MPDVRPTTIKLISIYIENAMRFHKRVTNLHAKNSGLPFSSHFYVTFVYLTVKFAYLINVLLNFFTMNYLLNVSGSHAQAEKREKIFDLDQNQDQNPEIYNNNESLIDKTYRFYGWHVLKLILNGNDTELCGFFPRVTVCDFQV